MGERTAGTRYQDPYALARAVATRRRREGLTQQELADRAALPVSYIRHVEDHPADISPATLASIAAALGIRVADLTSTAQHRAPGTGVAVLPHHLVELSPGRGRELLGAAVVGRIGFVTDDGPEILPVNYLVDGLGIALRTAPDSIIATLRGRVAFEVDHLDDERELAWSVLVSGDIAPVEDSARLLHLERLSAERAWADDRRTMWMRITPVRVTARAIQALGEEANTT